MSLHRFSRWGYSIPIACLLVAIASNATAAHIDGLSQLGGWVYIDRNNDGHLAFSDEPNPEFVIGGVSISLFSVVNNAETFVSTIATDDFGRYLFENIAPGTYDLKEAQPIEYVDGIDTLGSLQSLNGQPIPPTASPGVATNDAFSKIVLTANVGGEFYNFGERIGCRLCLEAEFVGFRPTAEYSFAGTGVVYARFDRSLRQRSAASATPQLNMYAAFAPGVGIDSSRGDCDLGRALAARGVAFRNLPHDMAAASIGAPR